MKNQRSKQELFSEINVRYFSPWAASHAAASCRATQVVHQHNLTNRQEVQPGPRGARLAAVTAATESLLYSPSVEQLQETSLVGMERRTLAHREAPARPITAQQKLQVSL